MPVGEAIQLAGFILNASSKGLSVLSSLKKRQEAAQQSKKSRRQFLISLLQQSALSIQLGVELLLEYMYSSGEESQNYEADEWCRLLGNASLSAGATFESHVPDVLWSLKGVIPDIINRIVDESNEKVAKAKEFFRVASLLASAVFEDFGRSLDYFVIFCMASSLKLCATVLFRFPTNRDLLTMEIVNTILQLEERRVPIPKQSLLFRGKAEMDAKFIRKSIFCMFVLVSRLAAHCGSHNQARIQGILDNSRALGVGTLIEWNSFKREQQTSFGQQGVSANDLDGISAIAVNSKGQLIVAEHENRRIKTLNEEGQCLFIFENPTINDQNVIGQPVAMTIDKNDNVFVLMTRMRDYFIVKYDPEGKVVTWFEMKQGFTDDPARVCGMAINSQGAIFLGEAVSSRICVFEMLDNDLALRSSIPLKSEFSFCVDTYDNLYISQKDVLHIFKRAEEVPNGFHMKFERKGILRDARLRKGGIIFALAMDSYFQHVLVLTNGKKTKMGPILWFLDRESGAVKGIHRFPLIADQNICIASWKRTLYWVTKEASVINRITTLEQAMYSY
ncbi:uncharacterized protein LOC110238393 [Exaiptasia diaphana]|uniref:Uncharacterized protein n=1 Tax=Exaiptasia diaphana TaxID=2652724 RepID=A0A913X6N2_EXADI|nr:uncharacterized protein LOC110238393 [Exaiptasia diaphana]KXJ14777.1 B-box type zinc finger protein ncl-1 [Exaiptasia diaphana]